MHMAVHCNLQRKRRRAAVFAAGSSLPPLGPAFQGWLLYPICFMGAGKGVIVAQTLEEAYQAVDDMMVNNAFGSAGAPSTWGFDRAGGLHAGRTSAGFYAWHVLDLWLTRRRPGCRRHRCGGGVPERRGGFLLCVH